MATRFYLGSRDSTSFNPSFQGGWTDSSLSNTLEMRTSTQVPTSLEQSYYYYSESSTTQPYLLAMGRWISKPLAAQTITAANTASTIRAFWFESSGSLNGYMRISISVIASDGTTVRGGTFTGVGATEFPTGSVDVPGDYDNRVATASYGSDISVQEGDRLVIETGISADNNKSTTYTFAMGYGYHTGDSDAPANETATDYSAYNAWFEITANLLFATAVEVSDSFKITEAPVSRTDTYLSISIALKLSESVEMVSGGPYYCWGDDAPDSDELKRPWQDWLHSDGSAVTIDSTYGSLTVDEDCFGPVVPAPSGSKLITVTKDKYDTGTGTTKVYIRGDTSSFAWNAGSPSWTEYTAAVTQSWTYIQLKVSTT